VHLVADEPRVTVDQVIDNSFADEAVRQLGSYKPKS